MIAKCALLIDRPGGPLIGLIEGIRGLGFEVVRASNSQAITGLVRSLRRLSLVVVNGDSLKSNASQLVGGIKGQHPDLPIIWFTSDPSSVRGLPKRPEFVTDSVGQLEAHIQSLVREEFYSPGFVQKLIAAVQGVLTSFGLPARTSNVCIKSNLTTLSGINSFLFFSGGGLAGHMIVSASVSDLADAYRAQFAGVRFPGDDDLEDLLGEATNQIVGEIKRLVEPNADDCRVGLPHFIRGAGASFRHKAGVPSLAVEFLAGHQKLQFELCLHRCDGAAAPAVRREAHIEAGTVNLL